MGFFKVEDDLLVIDREEIRGIPVFRSILERDKGVTKEAGDNDGRKKKRAWKEFFYIFIYCDIKSWAVRQGLNDKEKHKAAIKDAMLPEDFKQDDLIKKAIVLYLKNQDDEMPSVGVVVTTLKGLKIANKIAENIIDNIETTIENNKVNKKRKVEAGETLSPGDDLVMVQNLVAQLNQLMDISTKIPKTIVTLEQLEERLTKEQSGTKFGRGNREIGNRADPTAKH